MPLVDARGVEISPGDVAIYGFTVGRSVAMAEAVVLAEPDPTATALTPRKVSLTASGRVHVRVVRRSYSSGEKPIVDVAPDRLVVLKQRVDFYGSGESYPYLPPSPLPTQDEEARAKIEKSIARSTEALREDEAPEWWRRPDVGSEVAEEIALAEYHAFHVAELKENRRKLRALDE